MIFLGTVDLCEGMGSSEVCGTHRVDSVIPSGRVILRMTASRGACGLM
jgi:hypothetical protein